MNFFSKTKGSVSIFLVIILVPVIVVCTIFIDVSRVKLAQGLAASSADLALNSVLTQYDMELSDYYGLMASCQNIDEFYDVAENYFEFCIVSQGVSTLDAQKWANSIIEAVKGDSSIHDLLQIDTEKTQATIDSAENANLANPVMMKEEIVDFMKYRAPIELLGELDTKNGFVGKLTSVETQIKMIPHETRIQKEKVEYYDAENKLLKEALIIYEILKDYEKIKYDGTNYLDDVYMEQIRKDMKSESETDKGLEETYKELHKKYVTYWANTKEYTEKFVSVESYVSKNGNKTLSGKQNADSIRKAIEACTNARNAYETAKTEMAEKLGTISFAKPDTSRTLNEVQYWVQMDKAMGDTYDKYVNAQAAFRRAMNNMVYAFDNKEDATKTVKEPVYDSAGNPVYDPITKQQVYTEKEEPYDIGEESYDGSQNINSAYASEYAAADSVWTGREGEDIYNISKTIETYSENALAQQLTDRTKAGQEIEAAVENLKKEYELITQAQELLVSIVDRLPDLVDLVNEYNDAFETWSEDVEDQTGKGSELIDDDKKEIDIIKGEPTDENKEKGLVRIDIKEEEVNAFQTRLQNTIDLFQSYRDTIESIRYRGTTIIGDQITDKAQTSDDGIKTFAQFEAAATSQKNGCTAPVVKKDEIPLYHDSKDGDIGLDEYIENTWDISDEMDSLIEVTHDNSPKFHDYDTWKASDDPDIDNFDAWLHRKFDLIEKGSEEMDGLLSKLKEMIKGFADSVLNDFPPYDNPYLSDNSYGDLANLPSKGASDPIKEDETGKDVEQDDDDVTKDLESSASVTSLFDCFDFESLLVSGRDNLYTMEYIMRMFTYETQTLEYVYEQARKDMPEDDVYQVKKADGATMNIGPGNAEDLYDGVLGEGGAWWTDEDKTLTYNKSLTNKMFNYTNNYSFGNEVEYIMYGGDVESSKEKIWTTLYFVRYALDLTPVMTMYWNEGVVPKIATAISGATAGVIPVPLIKAVICLGICAAEAAVDVNYLKAGLPVLFFKTKNQLFLKLELDPETFAKAVKDGTEYAGKTFGKRNVKIGKTDSRIFFSYSDYLRIFLYIQLCAAEDNVYLRTADVIQANMSKNSDLTEYLDNFEMGRALTYFNIQADVRVKPLMLTLPYAQQSGADALDTDSWNTFTTDTITRGY